MLGGDWPKAAGSGFALRVWVWGLVFRALVSFAGVLPWGLQPARLRAGGV